MATVVDRYSLGAGKGSLVVRRTLYLPSFSTLSIQRTFCCVVALFFGSATKFSVYTTDSAPTSSPFWNLTPCRSSNSCALSPTCFPLLASWPLTSLFPGFGSRMLARALCREGVCHYGVFS